MEIITIQVFILHNGKKPFVEWFDKLDDSMQGTIDARLNRVRLGNFGDCHRIKNGESIWELRIDKGPGYRIYFGKVGSVIVIVLVGGDKKTQRRDIAKAKQYWLEYKEEHND